MSSTTPYAAKTRTLLGLAGLAAFFTAATADAQMPVAHWTFDDGINNYQLTTVPDIVNGNDAVWQDMTGEMEFDTSQLSYGPGKIGGAVSLAGGTDQFFRVEAIPQINSIAATPDIGQGDPVLGVGVTWSAWFYLDSNNTDSFNGIFITRDARDISSVGDNSGRNWNITWVASSNELNTREGDVGGGTSVLSTGADTVQKGQWHHVAMVWGNVGNLDTFGVNTPSHRVYVDGALVAEEVDTQIYELVESGAWLIGDDSCCTNREFDGFLDDFAIFASALSTTEVETLYNNGLSGINASSVVTAPILPGDVNGDGDVLPDDYAIIKENLGKDVTARNLGDLDGSGKVDLDDYRDWLAAASPTVVASVLAGSPAPEPTAVALLVLAAACASRRRA